MRHSSDSEKGVVLPPTRGHREDLLAAMSLSERRLELAGVPTAVLEGGEGPPIVLLHGQGEFAATWLQVIPDLVKNHHVVAADLPGHGASALGDNALDADGMVAWVDALIEQTCSTAPVLAGHLLGGAIAARYAAAHRDRLRQLVLVDTLGLAPYRPSPRFALAMITFMAFPTETSRDRLFSRCFVDLDDVRLQVGERWDSLSGYALERARSSELKAALRNLMPKLGMPAIAHRELASISAPTAMIWGRHDLQVRLRIAEEARARYGWPLHVIDNAADDPAVEQPHAFLEALDAVVGEGQAARSLPTHPSIGAIGR